MQETVKRNIDDMPLLQIGFSEKQTVKYRFFYLYLFSNYWRMLSGLRAVSWVNFMGV